MDSFEKDKLQRLSAVLKNLKCEIKKAQRLATFKSINVQGNCTGVAWAFLGDYQDGLRYSVREINSAWSVLDELLLLYSDTLQQYRQLHVYHSLCRGKSLVQIEPNNDKTNYNNHYFHMKHKGYFEHANKKACYKKLLNLKF